MEFKKYRRTQIGEMREVTQADIEQYKSKDYISVFGWQYVVSISPVDKKNGSPKIGDMIARNPEDHNDQWLVAEQYFKDNFEQLVCPNCDGEGFSGKGTNEILPCLSCFGSGERAD